jgi:hypothetical protein
MRKKPASIEPRETCLVTWVYTDDGDGNHEYGDITQSYCSRALLSKNEQENLRLYLKQWYDSGDIVDVYVGPDGNTVSTYLEEMASIGQCLPELE